MIDAEEVIVNCILLRDEHAVAYGAFRFVICHVAFEMHVLILSSKHMLSI